MLDTPWGEQSGTSSEDPGWVEFLPTGTRTAGAYHCAECGYGVTVHATLPQCPMCAGTSWERVAWSPFARALIG